MKYFKLIIICLCILLPFDVIAQRGCCSWHSGVSHCDSSTGRIVCNDGTYSPSCGCTKTKKKKAAKKKTTKKTTKKVTTKKKKPKTTTTITTTTTKTSPTTTTNVKKQYSSSESNEEDDDSSGILGFLGLSGIIGGTVAFLTNRKK